MIQSSDDSRTALSYGKVFTTDEIRSAEQALIDAGLTDYKTEGQRIMVPRSEVERYNAALLEGGALPINWAEEWERNFEKTNLFTSERQLTAMREIALAKELRRVLKAVPSIADASVVWARSQNTPRWRRTERDVTATVIVRPRGGREVTRELTQSLRLAVATMIPDLSVENVTVFDQSTGRSHTAPGDGETDEKIVELIEQHTESYQRRISSHLAYIPDAVVSVNVDVDPLMRRVDRIQEIDSKKTVPVQQSQSSRNRTSEQRTVRAEPGQNSNTPRALDVASAPQTSDTVEESDQSSLVAPSYKVTEQEYLPAMPTAVQVSVAVPESYYRAVLLQRGETEGEGDAEKAAFQEKIAALRPELEERIRRQVLNLLPQGTDVSAVDVSSFTPVEREDNFPEPSITETASTMLSEWGGLVGLTVVSLFAIWLVYRSMPKDSPELAEHKPFELPERRPLGTDTDEGSEASPREEIQELARDNPTITASVLAKWLEENG